MNANLHVAGSPSRQGGGGSGGSGGGGGAGSARPALGGFGGSGGYGTPPGGKGAPVGGTDGPSRSVVDLLEALMDQQQQVGVEVSAIL